MILNVSILVDQYIHKWDGSQGELWFCVRPHVATVAEFRDWANDPESLVSGGQPRFNFSFPRGGQQCQTQLFPINLPSKIELWHGLTANGQTTPRWTRYDRARACRDSSGRSYAEMFNDSFASHMQSEPEANVLSSIEMHFYAGGEFRVDKFADPYRTTSGVPIPVFRPFADQINTSMFWLLGLMHRVGSQAALSELHDIGAYDLVLVDSTAGAGDETSGPTAGRLAGTHIPGAEPGDAGDLERAFFSTWLPALPAGPFPASIAPTIGPPDLPALVYCKAPRRNLTYEVSAEKTDAIFRVPTTAAPSTPAKAPIAAPSKLVAMEVEVIRGVAGDAFNTLSIEVGLRLTGRLVPYRRSPVPIAPKPVTDPKTQATRLPTIMLFEPDEDCRAALTAYLGSTKAAEIDKALADAASAAIVVEQPDTGTKWSLGFIGAQQLPWDGPDRCIRFLATPDDKAPYSAADAARGLARATVKFFVPTTGTKSATRVTTFWNDEQNQSHTIGFWNSSADPVTAAFNAVRITAADPKANLAAINQPTTRITQVFADDYDFERAQSSTAIEGSLKIATAEEKAVVAAAAAAGFPQPAGLSPFRNYAEGFADFNVLRQTLGPVASPLNVRDWHTQEIAEASGCDGELLGISQRMPFAQGWSESARDRPPGTDTVDQPTWQDVRDHVARLYRVDGATSPDRVIRLSLRHTFGSTIDVATLEPPLPLAWAVDLPTAAETRAQAKGAAVRDAQPFVRVAYRNLSNNQCTITFDPTVLSFKTPPLPDDQTVAPAEKTRLEQAFASGTRAWRALAEICDPKSDVTITLQAVVYDLFASTKNGKEMASSWQAALRDLDRIAVVNPSFKDDLRAWALQCFKATTPQDLQPFSRDFSIDLGAQGNLNTIASIGRIDWKTTRSGDRDTHLRQGSNDTTGIAMAFVGERFDSSAARDCTALQGNAIVASGRAPATTLDGAWQAAQDAAIPDGPAKIWRDLRQSDVDSITPEDGTKLGTFLDAMQSLRDGTDWFPIPGSPNYSDMQVTPVLVPCGFCPMAPHVDLGTDTERVIETFLATLQDYIDLAMPRDAENKVVGDAAFWLGFFQRLDGLKPAYLSLIGQLADQLLRAQPAVNGGTSGDVATRSGLLNGSMPTSLSGMVKNMLVQQPALFRTAKALLLSELKVTGTKPTLSPLAGAQFTRWTKPWTSDDTTPPTSTTLDVSRLIALAPLPTADPVTGNIAFVEPLEDSLYDNSFQVRAGAQTVEPFEAVIDRGAAANPSWMWRTVLPTTPIASEQQDDQQRRVPLASRRPVAPPVKAGAVPLADGIGGLVAQTTINLAKLVEGQAGTDPAGTYSVAAILDPRDVATLPFENDVLRLIYLVQGDEEGDADGSATAFQNDLFTVELSGPDDAQTTATRSAAQLQPLPETDLSKQLRLLSASPARSPDALTWMEKILPCLATVASDYVKRPTPPTVPTTGLRVQVDGAGKVSLVYSGPGSRPTYLRNAAFLLPRKGAAVADKSVAVLVLDVLTDLWGEVGYALRQSRNAGTLLGGYSFDPLFMTTAVPVTPPIRHRVGKAAKNAPTDWKPANLVKITNRAMPLTDLLALAADADVGGHTDQLFTPDKAKASGYRLVVTVWAEQFLRPAWGNTAVYPDGRHLPWSMECTMSPDGIAAAPNIEFTTKARHFSIDLQWWTPSGESALRLERIFGIAT